MSIEQLQENGLTGPFELADKSLVDAVCEVGIELQALQRQENIVRQLAGQEPQFRTKIDRHMEFKVMRDLCLDDNVKSVVSEHFGNDLFIWGSVFQLKSEGVSENIWHHDRAYENGRDQVNLYDTSNHFSILFALTDIGYGAGRIEYVKGSHQPIDGWNRDMRFVKEVPELVHDRIGTLTMERGQFTVFHSQIMHRSLPFEYGEPRISLAVRLARKGTQIPDYYPQNPNPAAETQGIARFIPSATFDFN